MKKEQYLLGATILLLIALLSIVYPAVAKVACAIMAFILICFIWMVIKDDSGDYF